MNDQQPETFAPDYRMPRVGVVLKPGQRFSQDIAVIVTSLRIHAIEVMLEPHVIDDQQVLSFATRAGIDEMIQRCDFIIAIGGDGTMLGVMREVAKKQSESNTVKLLGVNMGTLGFITDVEMTHGAFNAVQVLVDVINGKNYGCEQRDTIQIALNDKKMEIAANDILIQRAAGRLLDFSVYLNDRFAYECRADGLLISTPTGSTAYSLAAGGPIIEPTAKVMLVSPMMPQNLSSRPIVLSIDTKIDVHLTGSEDAKLYIDGNECVQHDRIYRISRGPAVNYAFHKANGDVRDFTASLRNKLGWNQ
jgi:NAD+ kinase